MNWLVEFAAGAEVGAELVVKPVIDAEQPGVFVLRRQAGSGPLSHVRIHSAFGNYRRLSDRIQIDERLNRRHRRSAK